MARQQTRRHLDPVYGWANKQPPTRGWDGRPNSPASSDDSSVPSTFTQPSNSFTPASESFEPPKDWTD